MRLFPEEEKEEDDEAAAECRQERKSTHANRAVSTVHTTIVARSHMRPVVALLVARGLLMVSQLTVETP
jgi:hypothetical protein